MTAEDGLVREYLRDVDRALAGLPPRRRRQLVEEVRHRIRDARLEGAGGEASVRDLLERLGDPRDVAEDMRERFEVEPVEMSGIHVAALLLISVGGLVLPVLGWFAGVILLWMSPGWTARERLAGMLLPPGGLGIVWLSLFLASDSGQRCIGRTPASPAQGQTCGEDSSPLGGDLGAAVFVVCLALAVAVPVVLAVRLRRRAAAS